jgi:hypothetical protein
MEFFGWGGMHWIDFRLGASLSSCECCGEPSMVYKMLVSNACYHSVHNLPSSRLVVRIHKTTILPVVLYGCETWSLPLRKVHRLQVFEG